MASETKQSLANTDRAAVRLLRLRVPIEGMTCAACAQRVDRSLRPVDGVADVAVTLHPAQAWVTYDADRWSSATLQPALERAIRSAGYFPRLEKDAPELNIESELKGRLIGGAVFAVPLVVMAMSHGAFAWLNHPIAGIVQAVLALATLAIAGMPFFRTAWRHARHGTASMDTLVALGAGTTMVYSIVGLIQSWRIVGDHAHQTAMPIYFESAASIIVLVLLGKWIEAKVSQRTERSLGALLELQPARARVIRNLVVQEVDVATIQPGEYVLVPAGQRIAVDGSVDRGISDIDASMLTGESQPKAVTEGDTVHAGTLNLTGVLRIRAEQVGGSTLLQQLVHAVQEAQATKVPIARLADRISAIMVPIVLLITLGTFLVWILVGDGASGWTLGAQAAMSVMVISCPCALGLATPTAILVGAGRAARAGILIRRGQSLEHASKIDVVVLDKTGTVTTGMFTLVDVVPTSDQYDAPSLLRIAASVEGTSAHPLAKATVARAKADGLPLVNVTESQTLAGEGIEATVDSIRYFIGRFPLGTQSNAGSPAPTQDATDSGCMIQHSAEHASRLQAGQTAVAVSSEGNCLGWLYYEDEVRSDAKQSIDQLASRGIRVVILSGDRSTTVRAIADRLGIAEAIGDALPSGKKEFVESLRDEGKVVAMVGDGINDAPSLAAADVGIAFQHGADVAAEVADAILMRPSLALVPMIIEISTQTIRVVRQNLFWAFAYNLVAIPIAAGALYPAFGWLLTPMLASAAMAASSLSVVLNSALRSRDAG
jgi:P-type Cu+ transporter